MGGNIFPDGYVIYDYDTALILKPRVIDNHAGDEKGHSNPALHPVFRENGI